MSSAILGCWAAAIALAPSLEMKAMLAAPAVALPVSWWTFLKPGRWLLLFFATALLLPPLPIPIGDSGPHPSLVFAALGLFAGALWVADWRFQARSLDLAFVTLFAVLAVSVSRPWPRDPVSRRRRAKANTNAKRLNVKKSQSIGR